MNIFKTHKNHKLPLIKNNLQRKLFYLHLQYGY